MFADSEELADLLDMPVIRHTSQAFCLFADSGELADLLDMPVIRHTSQAFCLFADSGELADLLDMPVIRHTSQAFCLFADPGELAHLLDMPVPDLALRLIPAALPKLTEDQNTAALEALAHSVGYGLQQMILDYGFHVVAKYLYGGGFALRLCS